MYPGQKKLEFDFSTRKVFLAVVGISLVIPPLHAYLLTWLRDNRAGGIDTFATLWLIGTALPIAALVMVVITVCREVWLKEANRAESLLIQYRKMLLDDFSWHFDVYFKNRLFRAVKYPKNNVAARDLQGEIRVLLGIIRSLRFRGNPEKDNRWLENEILRVSKEICDEIGGKGDASHLTFLHFRKRFLPEDLQRDPDPVKDRSLPEE